MRIIDLGICIDNNDPKGLGRIRYSGFDDYTAAKEKMKNYKQWDDDDPYVASPFLPNTINFIPEEGQAVKILFYDTDKTTVNQEYIAGPFTTRFDFNSQQFSEQTAHTSYGVGVKKKKDIVNKDGDLPPNSKNALHKNNHFGINGKYGSDAIFTDNGVVLRGGKLISKDAATPKERNLLSDFPLVSDKVAKLQLKKFGEKKSLETKKEKRVEYDNTNLKYVIEYSIDDLDNPATLNFYIYRIVSQYGDIMKTDTFTEFTVLPDGVGKLLNNDNSTTTPTFTIDLTLLDDYLTSTLNNQILEIGSTIRTKLLEIQKDGLTNVLSSDIQSQFSNPAVDLFDIYPLYFRPTSEFRNRTTTTLTQKTTKQNILSRVKLSSQGPTEFGLIWSKTEFKPPSRTVEYEIEILKKDPNSREQTFGSLVGDKLFLLSTDTNFTDKKIDFTKLDSYEYTQEDYLTIIEPGTYALVRGEVLLKFIRSFYNVLTTHVHNINKPYVTADYKPHEEMQKLYDQLENDLLNKSIRIN